jgi:antitoxin component YwqK of YwqJK toxin-antitoxin module
MQKYYHDNGKLALEVNVVNGAESGVCKPVRPKR